MSDQNFVLGCYLGWYAEFLIEQGKLALALPIAIEGLECARTLGAPWEMSTCYSLLGRLTLLQGDWHRRKGSLMRAVTIATTASLFRLQCAWQPLLGIVTLYRDLLAACCLLDESLQLALQLDDHNHLTQIYSYLAEVDLWKEPLTRLRNG